MMMFRIAVATIALLSVTEAVPSGPGSCDSPNPLGFTHLSTEVIGGGPLSDYGLEVRIGGVALSPDTPFDVAFGQDLSIELVSTVEGSIFRGFLLKLAKNSVNTIDSLAALDGDGDVRAVQFCHLRNAGGIGHTDNNDKTAVEGILRIDEMTEELTLEVTTVIRNAKAEPGNEWYLSSYTLNAVEGGGGVTPTPPLVTPTTPPDATDAPVVPATPAPVTAAPVVPATPAPVTDAPVVAKTDAPVVPATPAPVTAAPVVPATPAPVTDAPVTTDAPVVPATPAPVTTAPVTDAPQEGVAPIPVIIPPSPTDAPVDPMPTDPPVDREITGAPVTEPPVAPVAPVTEVPVTEAPAGGATDVPATDVPATDVPATDVPATMAPVTMAPVGASEAPATIAPVNPNATTMAPATMVPVNPNATTMAPATMAPAAAPTNSTINGTTMAPITMAPVGPTNPTQPTPKPSVAFVLPPEPTRAPSAAVSSRHFIVSMALVGVASWIIM